MFQSHIYRLYILNQLFIMTNIHLHCINVNASVLVTFNHSGLETVKRNSSISRLYIFYQMFTVGSSILGPASVTLMIAGRFRSSSIIYKSILLGPCPICLPLLLLFMSLWRFKASLISNCFWKQSFIVFLLSKCIIDNKYIVNKHLLMFAMICWS